MQALEALKQRTQSFPGGQPDEELLTWFLRDRSLDVEEAVEKLRKVTAWRQQVRPDALSEDDVIRQISAGKGYMHDHLDIAGRPVVAVRVAKHFPGWQHFKTLPDTRASVSSLICSCFSTDHCQIHLLAAQVLLRVHDRIGPMLCMLQCISIKLRGSRLLEDTMASSLT